MVVRVVNRRSWSRNRTAAITVVSRVTDRRALVRGRDKLRGVRIRRAPVAVDSSGWGLVSSW